MTNEQLDLDHYFDWMAQMQMSDYKEYRKREDVLKDIKIKAYNENEPDLDETRLRELLIV